RADSVEREIGVGKIRLVLAQIASNARGPGDRPGGATIDRFLFREDADPLSAIDEYLVAIQQTNNVRVRFGKIVLDKRPNPRDPFIRDIDHQTADASVARVEALAGHQFKNVIDAFPHVEGVEERGDAAEV